MSKIIVQTVFKTAPVANFTIYSNEFISSNMPSTAKNILLYLLSKQADWQLRRDDLRKQLGLTNHAIKKALKWLQIAGYVFYRPFGYSATTAELINSHPLTQEQFAMSEWWIFLSPEDKP